MATDVRTGPAPHEDAVDAMPIHGIDHLELYVGNAAQAAYYYTSAFGFTETAYRGLETGNRERVSHVLEQGRIRLVLTGTLTGEDEIAEHHKRHGDGVHTIALGVPDAAAAYEHAVAHGARGLDKPYELRDDFHSKARENVEGFFGEVPPWLELRHGDLREITESGEVFDRVVLDMPEPWGVLKEATATLASGGLLCGFLPTTGQVQQLVRHGRHTSDGSSPEYGCDAAPPITARRRRPPATRPARPSPGWRAGRRRRRSAACRHASRHPPQ